MPSRPAAIASATSPPIISPAPRADEIEDPRPLAEIIRQWSSLHPEFVFLPRKFKIAVGATAHDRAALQMARHGGGDREERRRARPAIACMAGGGMGRTPYIAHVVGDFVEREDILAFLEAVMRVYNQYSRRDNIHKPRIKILVNAIGPEEMRRRVAREFEEIKRIGHPAAAAGRTGPHRRLFRAARIRDRPARRDAGCRRQAISPNWAKTNVHKHTRAGLCHRHDLAEDAIGGVPGDCSAEQMERWPI